MKEIPLSRQYLKDSLSFVKSKTNFRPKVALILGSGLGDFASLITPDCAIASAEIPHYPVSTVPGHAGQLIFGRIQHNSRSSKPLLVFKGRVHFYESGTLASVVLPVHLAYSLGARTLIVTNAAGGINPAFHPGHLMLIKDMMSFTFLSPACGNISASIKAHATIQPKKRSPSGPEHLPFTTRPQNGYFDTKLQQILRNVSISNSIDLQEGTYCWLKGPSYETASEIQMLRRLGADAVGMSTVPEVVAAKRLGMKTLGISLISNLATGISPQKLSHEEVTETANKVKETFTRLMRDLVVEL